MKTRTRHTFTISIPAETAIYRATLPGLGVIERIILHTDATPPQMVTLVLNKSACPINVSWEALRLLRLPTPWQLEHHARLLYENGDLLDLQLTTEHYDLIEIEFRDASGLIEITTEHKTDIKI